MSKKVLWVDESGFYTEASVYETSEFIATSAGSGDAGKPVKLDGDGNIDASMINDADIDHGSIGGLSEDDHSQYLLTDGTRDVTGIMEYDAHKTFTTDTAIVDKKYVDDLVDSLPDPMQYKGAFDASAGNYDAITNPQIGWYYKISVAGVIGSYDWQVGDSLIINTNVTGHPIESQIDKIDSTEAPDILRNTMLDEGEIFVGNDSDIATAVTPSGDVTMDYLGVFAIGADKVKDTMIDWGTGANQVSGVDMPLADAGNYFTTDNVEAALQELAENVDNNGESYTVGAGGVTKGDLVYFSGNKIVSTMPINAAHAAVGIALATKTEGQTVKVLANDCLITGILSSAAADTKYFWTGSAWSVNMPNGGGAYVWEGGIAANGTDLHVEVNFVKRNA